MDSFFPVSCLYSTSKTMIQVCNFYIYFGCQSAVIATVTAWTKVSSTKLKRCYCGLFVIKFLWNESQRRFDYDNQSSAMCQTWKNIYHHNSAKRLHLFSFCKYQYIISYKRLCHILSFSWDNRVAVTTNTQKRNTHTSTFTPHSSSLMPPLYSKIFSPPLQPSANNYSFLAAYRRI